MALSETKTATPRDPRPFSAFEWMLAGRYLRARRKEGFISVIAGFSFLGILLGVGTLIVVMAVMNGVRSKLFEKILGIDGHIIVQRVAADFSDYETQAALLRRVQGVKHVAPLIDGQVLVSTPALAMGARVRALTEDGLNGLTMVSSNVIEGSIKGFDKAGGVLIGANMSRDLGIGLGQGITLVSPRGAQTPFGTAPRIKRYRVVGIFRVGMAEYDKNYIFMPLGEAKKYFNRGDAVDVLQVLVDDPQAVGRYGQALRQAGGPAIHVRDWRERNKSFLTVLEVERIAMFIILSLIILVAAFNIICGIMMLVKDKSRDIAVLRTMGATKGAVMRVFLITGASIGFVGTLAGLGIGLLVCRNIDGIKEFVAWMTNTKLFDPDVYYLSRLPAKVDVVETAMVVAFALLLSVLATLYPSWRASRLDPVEALRYE